MATKDKYLAIYLNDHLAGSAFGRELASRAAKSNEGSDLGTLLRGLLREIEEDRETLLGVMRAVGVMPVRGKVALGWLAEKAGRLKLNGQLTGYSPLSRVIELEGLAGGITGKRAMWRALALRVPGDARLAAFDFDALVTRADAQLEGVESHRLEAARTAFS